VCTLSEIKIDFSYPYLSGIETKQMDFLTDAKLMERYEVMENLRNERTELMPRLIITASPQVN